MPRLVAIVTGGYTVQGRDVGQRPAGQTKSGRLSLARRRFPPALDVMAMGFGAVVIVLLSVLETSFQRKKEADVVQGGEVGKLNNEIARQGRPIVSFHSCPYKGNVEGHVAV